ncbi:unnamed protein product [Polarella glacialis]|uniref:Calmodulin-lysine N-methyltransferase n=1 Tax=Polarella glacialis TaxID=89957 RepID=A0A813E1W6_POLGL|nr:unnamed protein product [Polarella glacialis]CAE8639935.1 unnamed protein product [Polarella glacialis]
MSDDDGSGSEWGAPDLFPEDPDQVQGKLQPQLAIDQLPSLPMLFDLEEHQILMMPLEGADGASVSGQVWQSSLIISRAMLHQWPADVIGKGVLELGAGQGFPGILASKMGAKSVTFGDCARASLQGLRVNLRANFSAGEINETSEEPSMAAWEFAAGAGGAADVRIRRHLWEDDMASRNGELPPRHWSNDAWASSPEAAPTLGAGERFDTIIASDVLYFSSQVLPLLASLAYRLTPGGVGILVLPERNSGVFESFLETLPAHNLLLISNVAASLDSKDVHYREKGWLHETSHCRGIRLLRIINQATS